MSMTIFCFCASIPADITKLPSNCFFICSYEVRVWEPVHCSETNTCTMQGNLEAIDLQEQIRLACKPLFHESKNGPMCWYTPWRILVCKSKNFWGFDIGQILPNVWRNDILVSKWIWPHRYKIRWATQSAASFVSSILQILCFSTWKNHLLVRFRKNLPIGGSILPCVQKLLPHEPSWFLGFFLGLLRFFLGLLAGLVVFASVPLPLLVLYFHPVLSCHGIVSF